VKMAADDRLPLPYAGDLYCEMVLAEETARPGPKPPLLPGLAVCGVVAAAASWLSDHYGMPVILMGLLLGLALNFIAADARTHRGLDFVSRVFLRLGIVVLGTQVTFAQIGGMGPLPFIALLMVMALAFAAAVLAARFTGQSLYAGILAGGATAICGASAALALYGIIGKDRLSQAQFAITLVSVALASAVAMSFYPLLADLLKLEDTQAGFLIGASIHDVAQAIGGGFAVSNEAGSHATIVKLARVALLAPVVALVSLWLARREAQGGPKAQPLWRQMALPWFILAFLGMVALNSLVTLPAQMTGAGLILSKAMLLLAVTATALRARLDLMRDLNWRCLMPVAAATLTSLVASLGVSLLLI
jgi:uncharacterized integral membrane protein (TIGR00698 family)